MLNEDKRECLNKCKFLKKKKRILETAALANIERCNLPICAFHTRRMVLNAVNGDVPRLTDVLLNDGQHI